MGRNDRIVGDWIKNSWRSRFLEKVCHLSIIPQLQNYIKGKKYVIFFFHVLSGTGISGDPFSKFRRESPVMKLGKLQKPLYVYGLMRFYEQYLAWIPKIWPFWISAILLFLQLMRNPSTPQQFWLPLLYDSVSHPSFVEFSQIWWSIKVGNSSLWNNV